MRLATPEGTLTIDDDVLTYEPADNGSTVTVPLDPMPEYRYERSIYGTGALVIADAYIVLRNEDAEAVVTELRRPLRKSALPAKTAPKAEKP